MSGSAASSGWRVALVAALVVCAARLVWLIAGGLGLVADEAHYWEWSRYLDWSYPTKGPGIAAAIWASTQALGDEPWAVRLPAVIAGSAAMLAGFGLAREAGRALDPVLRRRVALWAMALVALFPAYQFTALLVTIDMPYVACWIASTWAALVLMRTRGAGAAVALGVLLGVGFLFKYTILLLVPGLIAGAVVSRRRVPVGSVGLAGIAFVVCCAPVIVWNAREGWPTVAHLLGHLGLPGGDVPVDASSPRSWTVLWFLEYTLAQLGMLGPGVVLLWLGARSRSGIDRAAHTLLVCSAVPIVVVYLGVSLMTDAEANWPIAGYAPLIVLAACSIPGALDERRARLAEWRSAAPPRPRAGIVGRAPESLWQLMTHWTVGFGVGACVLIALVPLLTDTGTGTGMRETGAIGRITEGERYAAYVRRAAEASGIDLRETTIIATRYTQASLLAHELRRALGDEAPLVTSAASLMGDRRSSYDYWPETDPRTVSAPTGAGLVVFVGGLRAEKWTRRFEAASITPMLEDFDPELGGVFLGRGFVGARAAEGAP